MNYPDKAYTLLLLLFACLLLNACDEPQPANTIVRVASFKKVQGIKYTEVKRYFNNGYSFNEKGYQLEPNWRLTFVSHDSVNIFNPKRNRFVNSPMLLDHDSVFNIAWAYLRLKKVSKDSIIFQVLRVNDKVIDNENSNVYMTLYANDYITNVLHRQPLSMQVPTRRDTLYIKKLTEQARVGHSKAFAARQIAQITSLTPLAKVEKIINDDRSDKDKETSDAPMVDYLSPEYHIRISKAYDDFSYYFTVYVDEQGQVSYGKSMVPLEPEFAKTYPRTIKALINGYMKAYLKVKPGTTLGIPHTSEVIIRLTGTKK